jgi:hypothetical protein
MYYQDQIQNYLNSQSQLNELQSTLLQKKEMMLEKAEAIKGEGIEDVGLSTVLGELGVSSIKSLLKSYGISDDMVDSLSNLVKGGLSTGKLNLDDIKALIPDDVKELVPDIKSLVPDVKAVIPDSVKAVIPDSVKGLVPENVKSLIPDVEDVKAVIPSIKTITPEIKAILPDIKPLSSSSSLIKSSSSLVKPSSSKPFSINEDVDADTIGEESSNIFYRSLENIGPKIKGLVDQMRKPAIKETNIDDLLFKRDLAGDADPLSIQGAPESIKMFSDSGEFVGNTLSRVYNESKLMQSLPDIAPSLVKPPPPAPEASEAIQGAEDIAPKVAEDVAPKLAEDIVPKIASNVAEKAVGEVAGEATTEAIGGALDATGILAPIGALVGLGGAIYSAFTGIEDLFKTHHASAYIPPPITSLFQAT